MKRLFWAIFGLFLLFNSTSKAQSPLDGFDVNVNGSVADIVIQTDGKIIIGGSFTQVNGVNRNYLARLNANRTVDTSFNPNPNFNVHSLLIQPDGKILVGGGFNQIGGVGRPAIARLETDGTVDNLYAGIGGWVNAIALEGNGNILIGGFFNFDYGGTTLGKNFARLDAAFGTIDDTFITNPDGGVTGGINSIAVLSSGEILVGGYFSTISGVLRNDLAILNPTSGNPSSFNPYPNNSSRVNSMVVQPNGKVLVAGELLEGRVFKKVARIDLLTGAEDPTFSASFSGETENPGSVYSIALQPNGKVLVGGFFNSVNGQTRLSLARLNSDGSLDSGFIASNPNGSVTSFAIQPSGKILMGGGFTNVAGQTRNNFAGLEVNGELDKTLDLGTLDGAVRIIVPQPDGKVIIAGLFTSVLGVSRNKIARLNPDGSLDVAFNPNPNTGRIFSVTLDSLGRIYVGGEFTQIGGQNRQYLARLDPVTGSADPFGSVPIVFDYVLSIYVDLDGNVLVSGGVSPYLIRLDPNTGSADTFYPAPNGDVDTILEQPDRKILIAGNFTELSPEGIPEVRNRIARLFPDGTIDHSFNANIDARVVAMKYQIVAGEPRILIGGNFTQVNGFSRNFIARLNTDGSLDTAFIASADNGITSISLQSNGKILVTGYFSSINGLPRNRVARLNEISGLPELFGGTLDEYDPDVNGNVFASAILPDGKVLIGGDFSTVGGISRSNFSRLTNDTYAVSNLTISQNSISWQVDGSTPQFNLARFELSTDGGQTYSFLGNGNPSLNSAKNGEFSPNAPQAASFTLSGLNLPIGQTILIRASSSDSAIEKLQTAFLLAPSAANISISGRVLSSNGRGLSNAFVSFTDSNGATRTTRTNSFGFYRFSEIQSGQTVVIGVRAKNLQFAPRVLSVSEDLADVDFTPFSSKF